jgi:hypothetical protein
MNRMDRVDTMCSVDRMDTERQDVFYEQDGQGRQVDKMCSVNRMDRMLSVNMMDKLDWI